MAYVVNNSRGQVIAVVQDGTINTNATSVTLVGKNVTPYGEYEVENLVKTLENFADDTPPINAIEGQLWWDTGTDQLKVWTGDAWSVVGSVIVSPITPSGTINVGDLWFNSNNYTMQIYAETMSGFQWIPVYVIPITNTEPTSGIDGSLYYNNVSNQLFIRSGGAWQLVGPDNLLGYGTTRWQSQLLLDVSSIPRPVIIGYVNGVAQSILSNTEFTIRADVRPTGFEDIKIGLNLSATGMLQGRASSADRLATPRTINGVEFDGTGNIVIPTDGVTEIGIIAGPGISVGNSPVTSSGNITINNTGVTSLSVGAGLRATATTGQVGIVNTGVLDVQGGENVIVTSANGIVTVSAPGVRGPQGPIGPQGPAGPQGQNGQNGDRYLCSSSTELELFAGSSTRVVFVPLGLAYSPGQSVIVANSASNYFEGTVLNYSASNGRLEFRPVNVFGSGTYSSWTVNLGGATGPRGPQGETGATGPRGTAGPAGDRYSSTSSTPLMVGNGSRSFYVGVGYSYSIGQYVVISNSPSIYMEGRVTAYNSSSGLITVEVSTSRGSGTYSSWSVNLAGLPGPQGATGPQGPEGPMGPPAQAAGPQNSFQYNASGAFYGASRVLYESSGGRQFFTVTGDSSDDAGVFYRKSGVAQLAGTGIVKESTNYFVAGWIGSTGSKIGIEPGVNGNIQLEVQSGGRVKLPQASQVSILGGANGQLLSTDGNGNLRWVTVGGNEWNGNLTSPSGWARASNGLTFQWGRAVTGSAGRTSIVFPVTFTQACFSVQIMELNAQGWAASSSTSEPTVYGTYNPPTRSGFTAQGVRVKSASGTAPGESGLSFQWFAIGF
jgi:hypothetical protein